MGTTDIRTAVNLALRVNIKTKEPMIWNMYRSNMETFTFTKNEHNHSITLFSSSALYFLAKIYQFTYYYLHLVTENKRKGPMVEM